MTKKKEEINIAAVMESFRNHCESYQETGQELAELINAELSVHQKKSDKASKAKCKALSAALESVNAGISVMQSFNSMKPAAYQQAKMKTFRVAGEKFLDQEFVKNRPTTQAAREALALDPVYDLVKKVRSFNKYLLPHRLNVLVGEDEIISVPMDYNNLSSLEVKTEATPTPVSKTKARPVSMGFLAPPKESYQAPRTQSRAQETKEQPLQDVVIHIREEPETKEVPLPFLSSDTNELQTNINAADDLIKNLMIELHQVEKNKNSKNRCLGVQYEVLQAGLDCLTAGKQLMECELRGQTQYGTKFKEAYGRAEKKFRELIRNNEILYKKSDRTEEFVCLAKILLKINEEPWGVKTVTIQDAKDDIGARGFFYTHDRSLVSKLKSTSQASVAKDMQLDALLEELGKIAEKINPLGADLFRRPYTAQEQAKLNMIEAITHLVYVGCHAKKIKSVELSLDRVKNLLDQYHAAYTILGFSIIDKPIMKIIALVEDTIHPQLGASQQP